MFYQCLSGSFNEGCAGYLVASLRKLFYMFAYVCPVRCTDNKYTDYFWSYVYVSRYLMFWIFGKSRKFADCYEGYHYEN